MSDAEDTESESFYKPSFILIAIDTHPSMFVKAKKEDEDEPTSPFQDSIKACYEVADSLIFTQNKRSWSPFAIVLAQSSDATASFVNFKDNVLNSVKTLKTANQLSNEKLSESYMRKGGFDLSAFLLFCKKKFKEISSVYYKRTIIYITNDDNPCVDKNQRFAAMNEAKNFEADDIDFQVVTTNPDFDYSLFYNELFSVMKQDLIENIIGDVDGLIEKLTSSVIKRYYQRKLNFFPFLGDNKRFIRIVQKNFIQEFKLYNNSHMCKDDASGDYKIVKKVTKTEIDRPKSFKLKLKGESIEFDLQENFDLKNNDLPVGYSLLHVSNRITEPGLALSNSCVLESDFKEDLTFFDSFWQYCVDKDKVLVCVRKLKHLDKIRFVELIPKYANNARHFVAKTIPFASEIKHPPSKFQGAEVEDYGADKVEVVQELIEKLTFDYDPRMFPNPAISYKKAYLKAKFLGEDVERPEDVTLDKEAIDEQVEGVAARFKDAFELVAETGKKRKSAAPSSRGRAKKAK